MCRALSDSRRSTKRASGSLWVRLSPPLPASRNFRPTEPIVSYRSTAAPAAHAASAAIRPAGPPPMIASRGGVVEVIRAWSHAACMKKPDRCRSGRKTSAVKPEMRLWAFRITETAAALRGCRRGYLLLETVIDAVLSPPMPSCCRVKLSLLSGVSRARSRTSWCRWTSWPAR